MQREYVVAAIGLFLFYGLPHLLTGKWREIVDGVNAIYVIDLAYKEFASTEGKNQWKSLSLVRRQESCKTEHPYVPIKDDPKLCIDRIRYRFEFSRLLGVRPYFQSLSTPRILVIGDKTMIGHAIIQNLESRK
jgi:hypothetical protein